jgi:hypothetical protein
MSQPTDAVTDPNEYRAEILGWLGDDDPATVQAGTTDRMRQIVEAAGRRLRERPRPTEWSVIECVGHLVDSEVVASARIRWVIAEDEPDLVAYDQDRWVDGLHHRDASPDELLALFDALRRANLQLWTANPWTPNPAPARERIGLHRERGPESYEVMFRMMAGHDRLHLAQAQRVLDALVR